MRLVYRTISGVIFLQGVVFLQLRMITTSYKGNKPYFMLGPYFSTSSSLLSQLQSLVQANVRPFPISIQCLLNNAMHFNFITWVMIM